MGDLRENPICSDCGRRHTPLEWCGYYGYMRDERPQVAPQPRRPKKSKRQQQGEAQMEQPTVDLDRIVTKEGSVSVNRTFRFADSSHVQVYIPDAKGNPEAEIERRISKVLAEFLGDDL